ncbi:hypothetical protein ES319_D02G095200v1 [Gossypium barbadense]|uniref:Fibronectin type III-like domain-containing protein n=1 Tax=Gossypium barbadense TaxID=3634 RepID=A0A5J5SAU4_GOSBA|nr:hypothetical protein ES319_D02G095200v1 [Gossypium barbadense]
MKLQTPSLLYLVCITSLLFILSESTQPPFSCDASDPATKSYPFCETTLPITQRVRDLVSRRTLGEKISQLVNSAPAIPRLGIPDYQWWSEALHGLAVSRGMRFNGTIRSATSFPQVILTAASSDVHLWYRIAQAVGIEGRAIYNVGQAMWLTFWAPNINIFRDPRWGRGQETPGEDPLVTGKYAVSYVRGIQGDSFEGGKLGENLQASACWKHFTAYDLDNWKGVTRYVFNANIYQPPFQSCIEEGKASGVMCAYNRVNGVPNCADYNLLSKTARGQWGFNGYITADCDAVATIYEQQGYVKVPEDAAADVRKAAVEKRKLSLSEIDRALYNLFSIRMRLGLFNGNPVKQPFGNSGLDQICSQEHQNLALEAARNGIVLLKNAKKTPSAFENQNNFPCSNGPQCRFRTNTSWKLCRPSLQNYYTIERLQSYVKDTRFHQGCSAVNCSSAFTDQAMNVATGADRIVLVMGLDQTQEREKLDRVDLVLPPKQQNLISAIARAAKNPIILVLLSGGPVDISFAKNDPHIGSILWAGYPGEAGGRALAEIIFGDHNPGGRLPVTWYPQSYTNIPMTDMRMRPEPSSGYPGRTYRFYQGLKVFEFSYGLSYSNYTYEFLPVKRNKVYLHIQVSSHVVGNSNPPGFIPVSKIGTEVCDKIKHQVTVRVENNGEMAGKHSLLLFVRPANMSNMRPVKQLVAFQSVNLKAGERAEIELQLRPCEHLSLANEDGTMVIEEGSYFLSIGDKEIEIQAVK